MGLKHLIWGIPVAALASVALGHGGVTNPAVMARMEVMSTIGKNMKIIGQMAKGETAFDAETARTAAGTIADAASQTPGLFEAHETDPKSEALPVIWEDFEDFSAKATALETAARNAAASIETAKDLRPAMGGMGGTCKSCHSKYRIQK